MTFPDRNNPYSFNEYLAWRDNIDYYTDDPFIQKVVRYFAGDTVNETDRQARKISKKASFAWRELAEAAARPEKQPFMIHYDGHHNRIDRIVRPRETEIMEKEVFGHRFFSDEFSPGVKLIRMFLVYQNGEACIGCPVTCTEGLVKLLEKYADTPETKQILKHCKEGIEGDVAIGAQYLSEIQGGSDVPANILEAVQKGDTWRLYGSKFFCSATHADYVLVTAKPKDSEKVALFVMPSWLPGNKRKEIRNGYTIDRIKWKMGTSELTTGELTFNGAVAYPIGPLDRGVANVVGIVLTYSRLTVGLAAAAFMTRAVREAKKYSEMREAFGVAIGNFPLVKYQITDIEKSTRRTTAGAFKVYNEFLNIQDLTADQKADSAIKKQIFRVRQLVMLQKITASLDSTDVIRTAMSIFGGHGVMEDFSSLPRLYRDSAINELWEGPRNVLLTQIFNDLKKVQDWYEPAEFFSDLLIGADPKLVTELAEKGEVILGHPDLFGQDDKTLEICRDWDKFCHSLFHAYQDVALMQVEMDA